MRKAVEFVQRVEREERAVRVGEEGGGDEELSEACEGEPKSREFRADLRMGVGGEKHVESAGDGEAGRWELSRDGEGRASAEEEGSLSSGTPKEINENTLSPTKAYYNDTPFIMAYATQCVRRRSFQVRR